MAQQQTMVPLTVSQIIPLFATTETVIVPETNDPEASVLELDELWSFVLKKRTKRGSGSHYAVRRVKWLLTP